MDVISRTLRWHVGCSRSDCVMSDFSGTFDFDQLADALKSAGPTPSATLRHARAARKKAYAARGMQAPTPLEPIAVAQVIPAKPPREIDRSRDHAVYAAPHRPLRPHMHSRPDDIATERGMRRVIATASATASKASRTLPIVTLAFCLTVALGAAACALIYGLP